MSLDECAVDSFFNRYVNMLGVGRHSGPPGQGRFCLLLTMPWMLPCTLLLSSLDCKGINHYDQMQAQTTLPLACSLRQVTISRQAIIMLISQPMYTQLQEPCLISINLFHRANQALGTQQQQTTWHS